VFVYQLNHDTIQKKWAPHYYGVALQEKKKTKPWFVVEIAFGILKKTF
jgi:hypothetical protein